MKNMITVVVSLLLSLPAWAGLSYTYAELTVQDLDGMSKIVQKKVNESRKARGNKIIPLREGLQAVLARPDSDGMIEKVINPLRSELEQHDAYETALQDLTKEALQALGHPKAFRPVVQVTYWVFLENLMSELKPKASEPFERGLLTQIRDAKIKPSPEAKSERKLRILSEASSPSDIADQILKPFEKPGFEKKKTEQ